MSWPKEIVLVGAGKVAWHLGRQLKQCGCLVSHVFSRTEASAIELAEMLACGWSTTLSETPSAADLYLLLVPDGAIGETAKLLREYLPREALVLHTSGATPASVLAPYFPHHGVFYPLQTFSKARELDFTQVPLCLYTAIAEDYQKVEHLAKQLVKTVKAVDDRQRAQLHLAAVFVNNFTNYLQYISRDVTSKHELPNDLLQPLLRETIAKLETLSPQAAQTGPAIRQDAVTIDRHLAMLQAHPAWAELYRLLSDGIARDMGGQ